MTLSLGSVFLVLLEYYEGVLILTTNRTDSLDAAFESRIDIVLSYPGLTPSARKDIWSNFVKTLPPDDVQLSSKDLVRLSQWVLNGRQIKSAIKTARVLACQDKAPLRIQHLITVLNIRRRGAKLLKSNDDGIISTAEDISALEGMLRWCLAWLLPVRILAAISVVFDQIQKRGLKQEPMEPKDAVCDRL